MGKRLVAYFSASGTTKKVAEMIASAADADMYEIVPKQPYLKADLNWMDKKSRSSVDMNTFLENYDFSGKKLVLFATSGGRGFAI